jgi:hypothetical protein
LELAYRPPFSECRLVESVFILNRVVEELSIQLDYLSMVHGDVKILFACRALLKFIEDGCGRA